MTVLDGLHFIRPLWLLLLPFAVLLPWLWRRTRRPTGDWSRVCDPHLLRWLAVEQAASRRRRTGPWLAGTALLIAIVALAGPSWQRLPDSSWSARDARVIALDLSLSMMAEDLRPSRLTRARFRLADLLGSTEEGQVGLVTYAGDAYVVSPLSSDMNTVANLLPALRPDVIPVGGSRADRALELAADLLRRSGLARGEILLVTDSATSRDAAQARKLRDAGIRTSVLAVGTVDGAPIPSGGGFVSDRAGNVIIARMDRGALQALADAGGGRYSEIGASATASVPWPDAEGTEFARRDDLFGERWRDAGPWLVLLLIPLVLAGFRRGLFFVVPLLVVNGLALPGQAEAGWWDDLWLRKDQQAYQALAAEDPERAAALARDPELSGEAWYRGGEYSNAHTAWSASPSADTHYNRGNALALLGEYDAALEAYDAALERQPGMPDALYNRSIVEQLKQESEQQQQQQQGDGQEQSGDAASQQDASGEDSSSAEESQQGDQGENGEPSESQDGESDSQEGEGQSGERSENFAEAWSAEDAQAMEQWLRRIPDDPGGLLRRKFRSQHLRRGAPEDESEAW